MNESERMRWPVASGPHLLNLLPSEIRGEIFNKLKQSEAYKLRLVCRQWNEDIKDFYDFEINFNEDSPGLASILKLRIAKLKVRKLGQERFRILPVPEAEVRQLRSGKVLQGLHDLTFKYPNCLRRVVINHVYLIKPQRMAENDLREFLQLCQKSVTHLELALDCRYQFQPPSCFQFRNLKRLDLSFSCWTACLFRNDSILYLLKNSQFPSLRFLKAEFSVLSHISKTAIAVAFILKLLTKAKLLEEIMFKMSDSEYHSIRNTPPDLFVQLSAPELPDMESLEAVTDLKHIGFFVDFLRVVRLSTNMKLLVQLLPRQRVLQTLYLGMNHECSSALLCSILLKNSETIVRVGIRKLTVNSEVPFDISVLKNCQKLESLSLTRDFDDEFPPEGSGPELINCHSFPASLTNLSLEGVRILSQDLLGLLQSDMLLSLEELCLCRCGDSGDYGINLAVLKQLGNLKTKMKKNLKLTKMKFQGFNCSGPREEVWKIKAALRKLVVRVPFYQRWLLGDDDDSDDDEYYSDLSVVATIWRREQGSSAGHWECVINSNSSETSDSE